MLKKTIDRREIEKIVSEFTSTASGAFSVNDIIAQLPIKQLETEELERVELTVNNLLDVDETTFGWHGSYMRMCVFFDKQEFCISPDAYELEQGVLFPGHRFAIFSHPEIFMSEIVLKDAGTNRRFSKISNVNDLEKIIPYYTLFGLEQINDYLIADSEENYKALRVSKKGGCKIVSNVFDMKKFYQQHDFELGDAVRIKISDWTKGIFEASYIPGNKRKNSKLKQWEKKFADALELVIDEFGNYMGINMQLNYAYYVGGQELLTSESLSLDEFYRQTTRFEICIDSGETFLAKKSDIDVDEEVIIPEGISISQGKTETMEEILNEIGIPLKTEEIEGFMLDQHFRRELELVDFFSRCFGTETLKFIDDAQETAFLNMIDDLWEKITANYNRHEDLVKAHIREYILELTEERVDWLRTANSSKNIASDLIKDDLAELSKISVRLGTLLKMLNSESYSITQDEAEKTMGYVEKEALRQRKILDVLSQKIGI